MVKKLVSEFVGTMLLVFFGCGTAVAVNTYVNSIYNVALPFTMILIALAFGLVLTAIISAIGHVSGAHVNPAVTIAMAIDGRMDIIETIEYIVVQILGAIVGAEILGILFNSYKVLGANGYGALSALPNITTLAAAIIIEIVLTFTFVLVVLVVSSKKDNGSNSIVIGLTLALVHIMGIPFTGSSVNPARSIGPAIFTGGEALNQLWVFILAPIAGAVLAAVFYKFVLKEKTKKEVPTIVEKSEVETKPVKKVVKPTSAPKAKKETTKKVVTKPKQTKKDN